MFVLLDQISRNSRRLSDDNITVLNVGDVREVGLERRLVNSEPVGGVVVMLVGVLNFEVSKKEADGLSESTDAPVAKSSSHFETS